MNYQKIDEFVLRLVEDSTPERTAWNMEKIREGKPASWNYIDGCMLTALMEMEGITGDERYSRFVKACVDHFVGEDGSIRTFKPEVITKLLAKHGAEIVPVDSEHSAIFQSLMGEKREQASKIILTASGGPFRTKSVAELENVTVKDALRHPNWSMGAKVTIDSASMMNKGFEMIEAKWLFDFEPKDIEIVVHPQSIVHSMVEFFDGSIKAQLGTPDMRIPISLALGYPDRIQSPRPALTLAQYANLTFEKPDYEKFPLLGLAFEAVEKGGNMPCILNAANEKAVAAFLQEKIRFVDMPRFVEDVMAATPFVEATDLDVLVASNSEALEIAEEKIKKYII